MTAYYCRVVLVASNSTAAGNGLLIGLILAGADAGRFALALQLAAARSDCCGRPPTLGWCGQA